MAMRATEMRAGRADGVAVIVLTGGASRRMGSHKPALDVGGRPIVRRVLDAAAPNMVVVVGSAEAVPPDVLVVREDPPGGGPVAGIAAGVTTLLDATRRSGRAEPAIVVVLAGDLPLITPEHVDRLVAAVGPGSGGDPAAVAVTRDVTGYRNWLCAAWRTPALRERLAMLGDPRDRSVRSLVGDAALVEVRDEHGVAADVDTPEDLARARERDPDRDR